MKKRETWENMQLKMGTNHSPENDPYAPRGKSNGPNGICGLVCEIEVGVLMNERLYAGGSVE